MHPRFSNGNDCMHSGMRDLGVQGVRLDLVHSGRDAGVGQQVCQRLTRGGLVVTIIRLRR